MNKESAEANVTLKIPRPLYVQLKQVIEGSGFHSVTEFVVYILRDLVSHHGRVEGGLPAPDVTTAGARALEQAQTDVEPLSPEEIEAIRKRLESLGYL
ncbi:MAG: CopG family transcriptional regulator [Actinomycetota bacterium]